MGIAGYGARMPQQTDQALDALVVAVRHAQEGLEQVLARAAFLKAARAEGRPYADLVAEEDRPLLVERLTHVLDELSTAGAAFRRAEARVLHAYWLSQDAIARLFGVTRQRVGALLGNAQWSAAGSVRRRTRPMPGSRASRSCRSSTSPSRACSSGPTPCR